MGTMEVVVLEESKKRMMFRTVGEGHTLLNILKKELWSDSHITAAGYEIKHPLEGIPTMIVETDGKESPREALRAAISRLKKTNKAFLKDFKV